MNITTFIDVYWMLTERTKKWLVNHPERFEEFRADFEREPLRYMRSLTWPEIHAIEDAEEAVRPVTRIYQLMEPPTDAIREFAAFSEDAIKALGEAFASAVLERCHRPGFMRKYLSASTEHTVPECTRSERSRVDRIVRRLPFSFRKYENKTETFRNVLHIIRQQ